MAYELADGKTVEYQDFGLAEIEFMGEITSGRVIFGPEQRRTALRRDRPGIGGHPGGPCQSHPETNAGHTTLLNRP